MRACLWECAGFVVPLMINTLNMMGSSDRGEGLMDEDKSTSTLLVRQSHAYILVDCDADAHST
jgi:hypothetical protein